MPVHNHRSDPTHSDHLTEFHLKLTASGLADEPGSHFAMGRIRQGNDGWSIDIDETGCPPVHRSGDGVAPPIIPLDGGGFVVLPALHPQ